MRVTLKFEKLFGTDIELESQGYMVQKYGIVSAILYSLLSNYYLHTCMMTPNCAFIVHNFCVISHTWYKGRLLGLNLLSYQSHTLQHYHPACGR